MSVTNDRLFGSMARATSLQYLNTVLVSLKEGETVLFAGLMQESITKAVDDFDDWEAVPKAAEHDGTEEEAAKIMADAVNYFVESLKLNPQLSSEFHAAVQKSIAFWAERLTQFMWDTA